VDQTHLQGSLLTEEKLNLNILVNHIIYVKHLGLHLYECNNVLRLVADFPQILNLMKILKARRSRSDKEHKK